MSEATDARDRYLSEYEQQSASSFGAPVAWLRRLRQGAAEVLRDQGFPTTRDEEWCFTPLAPLLSVPFARGEYSPNGLRRPAFAPLGFEGLDCHELVFVNGHLAVGLSSLGDLPKGVTVMSLKRALSERPEELEEHLGRAVDPKANPFVALNTSLSQDGAYIRLARGVRVPKPIHLLFVSASHGEPSASHPRVLVVADEGSHATLLESYGGLGETPYFTNAVTEVVVAPNAQVDHAKIQRETEAAYHVATLQVAQAGDSTFSSTSISLGGALTRNNVNVVLGGEGIESSLNGLYMARGSQLVDNHTLIDHAKPHCNSHEFYKGVLDDRSRGVFNGKVYVRLDAQKTDAKQTNQNLLLSDDASVNAKPQLEIFADDVKCTHGATVGQLDETAVFYLRTRGIGEAQARSILTYAFANEIVERIKVEPVRAALSELLLSRDLHGAVVRR
jgi:Fe-S cluster assembly protein SufD